MGKKVADVMKKNPITLPTDANAVDAAQIMRDKNVGDVLVTDDGELYGIVTDRDIVIRALAEGKQPSEVQLRDFCSRNIYSCSPEDDTDEALRLMREHAVRRLPVVEGNKPVGFISMGDLAVDRDRKSVLGDVSAAPPNQ
jgi:CBS domain-containing protein